MKDIYLDKEIMKSLMRQQGIRFDVALLRKIAVELEEDPEDFVAREKSNFSKMLRHLRTVNPNFIIPMEKILGVSILTMTGAQGYEVPDDPAAIPYLKNFRFFAFKDDPKQYEVLDKMTTPNGDKILYERDEYDREFLDYVTEYAAINGVRFLVEKHGLRYDPVHRRLLMDDCFRCSDDQTLLLALMLVRKKPSLFSAIYEPLQWLTNPVNGERQKVFLDPSLIHAIARNGSAVEPLMETKEIPFSSVNPNVFPKDGSDDTLFFVNPMLADVLDSGLADVATSERIRSFLSKHNQRVESSLRYPIEEYRLDERGFVCIGTAVYGNVVAPKDEDAGVYATNIKRK